MDHILTKFDHLKRTFKTLEFLIVDEADRFADEEFKTSISTILSCIPKQRRTGLFSATQAKTIEELLKFGLRNPVRINVSDDGEVSVSESIEAIKQKVDAKVAPKELENLYTVCISYKSLFYFYFSVLMPVINSWLLLISSINIRMKRFWFSCAVTHLLIILLTYCQNSSKSRSVRLWQFIVERSTRESKS